MIIDLYNIGSNVNEEILWKHLAHVLRSPLYTPRCTCPIEFFVRILRQDGRGTTGEMDVPKEIGERFLADFGGRRPRCRFMIFGTIVVFKRSTKAPQSWQIGAVHGLPGAAARVVPPIKPDMLSKSVAVKAFQFGYYCRDEQFSVEWEMSPDLTTILAYDEDRAMFKLILCERSGTTRYVAFRAPSIYWVGAGSDADGGSISFGLNYAPSFLVGSWRNPQYMRRSVEERTRRVSAFVDDHAPLAPYTSSGIRILCRSLQDVDRFRKLAHSARLQVDGALYPAIRRALFAPGVQESYEAWVRSIPWQIAFQMEAMVRASLVDLREAQRELRARIERMNKRHGPDLTSAFLLVFRTQLLVSAGSEEGGSLQHIWDSTIREFLQRPPTLGLPMVDNEDLFPCLHVVVTPTTLLLSGPFPEQSNRVIRQYKVHEDCFIRVSFLDETKLTYRHDRYVDTTSLLKERVRRFLVDGLIIAGRLFTFLAYSQSGLKEHAVWFVKPFRHAGRLVTAETIIRGLGSFRDLPYDRELMRCPARYAARLSQAFTATDSALSVQPEDMLGTPDITTEDGKYCFTDGVGTLSPELARAIWAQLQAKGRRSGHARTYPRLFQIRLGGSKGMLSVDYNLKGLTIALRPSMVKYDAPHSLSVEIVRAFDRPSRYCLNRPQIMLLEHLGVPYEVFKTLQDSAVRDVQRAVVSLDMAAHTLEAYGLGASYRLSSTMRSLHRLGVEPFTEDISWQRMMNFAVNHVLRELKHHARIPVPRGWTLVGVADHHKYLRENEIFACVDDPDGEGEIYLEGPIMVTRSPSIHPGDIQMVHAIGKPPLGSPLSREMLKNGVVFSTNGVCNIRFACLVLRVLTYLSAGRRPISTQLGGGDLDGDVYNLTPMVELHPSETQEPAAYEPAERRVLDRESTMVDVADFVTGYITSDVSTYSSRVSYA